MTNVNTEHSSHLKRNKGALFWNQVLGTMDWKHRLGLLQTPYSNVMIVP